MTTVLCDAGADANAIDDNGFSIRFQHTHTHTHTHTHIHTQREIRADANAIDGSGFPVRFSTKRERHT